MKSEVAMSKSRNPFDEIVKKHPKCAVLHLAQAAFNSTTYRIFGEGSGKKLRDFVMHNIGDGKSFASGPDFESKYGGLFRHFPRIRLNANTNHRKPGFGHKAKVIDLYLKTLYCQREPLSTAAAKRLGRKLHVPLDNIVLNAVWEDFRQTLAEKHIVKSDLTLSKLKKEHYRAIQGILAEQAKKAGTIAILYDDRYVKGSEQSRALNSPKTARSYRKTRRKN